jgi:hypothetical protein
VCQHLKLTHDKTDHRFDLYPEDTELADLLALAGDYLQSVPMERLDWESGMRELGWVDAEFDFLRQDDWTAYFRHRETGLEIDVAIANIPHNVLPTPCVYVEYVGDGDVDYWRWGAIIANRSDAWNMVCDQSNPDELAADLDLASWDAKRSFLYKR